MGTSGDDDSYDSVRNLPDKVNANYSSSEFAKRLAN